MGQYLKNTDPFLIRGGQPLLFKFNSCNCFNF